KSIGNIDVGRLYKKYPSLFILFDLYLGEPAAVHVSMSNLAGDSHHHRLNLHLSAFECHSLKQIRTIVVRSYTCQRCKDTSELELAPYPGKSPPHLFRFTRMSMKLHLSAFEYHSLKQIRTIVVRSYTCRI